MCEIVCVKKKYQHFLGLVQFSFVHDKGDLGGRGEVWGGGCFLLLSHCGELRVVH